MLPTPQQKHDIIEIADAAFLVLCAQISDSYLKFIKAKLMPLLEGDLSLREMRTLLCIGEYKVPIAGAVISSELAYDPATVSRSTKYLIDAGILRSENNPYDFRSTVYSLTEKGKEIGRDYRGIFTQAFEDIDNQNNSHLTYDERKSLLKALLKLRARASLVEQARKRRCI